MISPAIDMKQTIKHHLDNHVQPLADEIIAMMHQAHDLDVSAYDESFLIKSFSRRQSATGCNTTDAYLHHLSAEPTEAAVFYRSLTIPYSEFFRNPLTFGLLEKMLLPDLITNKKSSGQGELRIWSAGCATGQEPWSIAILLEELNSAREQPLRYRIFATDSSTTQLDLARSGSYNITALGNVRQRQLSRFFSRQGNSYTIADSLKEKVRFFNYNLLDPVSSSPAESIFADFDLIVCCNVLIYYRSAMQRIIINKLQRDLTATGYLVTGEAERKIVANVSGLKPIMPTTNIFQRNLPKR